MRLSATTRVTLTGDSMKTIKYIKPSGKEIEVNDDEHTRHYAAINGWKKTKGKPGPKPKSNPIGQTNAINLNYN